MAAPNPTCPSYKRWRGISARANQRILEDAKPPVFAPKFNVYVPAELQHLLQARPKKYTPEDLKTAVTAIKSSDKNQWLPAVKAVRKALSEETTPSIQAVLDLGALPRLVALMGPPLAAGCPELQLEAAWAVCNVASGTSQQATAVVEAGALQRAFALLGAETPGLREQAAWLLGNVAGDGAVLRDACLDAGLLPPLLAAVRKEEDVKPLRQYAFLLLNVTRFKPRRRSVMLEVLPVLTQMVTSCEDAEVRADGLSAFAHVTDDCRGEVVAGPGHTVVALAAKLLEKSQDKSLALPAAKVLSSLCAGDDAATQAVIDSGVLAGGYRRHLQDEEASEEVLLQVCFALSNIAAGTKAQATAVLQAGLLRPLVRVFRRCDNSKVHREAAWTLANMTQKDDPSLASAVLSASGAPPLAGLVEALAGRSDREDLGAAAAAAEALLRMAQVAEGAARDGGGGGDHPGAPSSSNAAVAAYVADGVYDTLQRAVDGGLGSRALDSVQRLMREFPPPPPPPGGAPPGPSASESSSSPEGEPPSPSLAG